MTPSPAGGENAVRCPRIRVDAETNLLDVGQGSHCLAMRVETIGVMDCLTLVRCSRAL